MENSYQSPLTQRYTSTEMSRVFSPQFKHSTWRKLWLVLARCQQELGLNITNAQLKEMEDGQETIDFSRAAEHEKVLRHDVMAHIHTFGEQCPTARPIIHLGATSCYVTDNSEIIQVREGLNLLEAKLAQVIYQLCSFSTKWKDQACLGFTHYQPAQLTTVGKRACMWMQDLLIDLKELRYRKGQLRFLGVKGTTGTQASFMSLFSGDEAKVIELDRLVSGAMGFSSRFIISGQTYSRKQDMQVFDVLSGIAASAHKFATDLRLLANLKEIEEPFESKQIGSSAMPYKRNPMRSERICALSRFILSLSQNPAYTASTQWLERSLDDSANRRLAISEGFLATDAVLNILINVTSALVVYPKVIEKHVKEELPFMATENILMTCVQRGGDRQDLHERLREHSIEAARRVKQLGEENQLLDLISEDSAFGLSQEDLTQILQVDQFVGRAPSQVLEFIATEVEPLLSDYASLERAPIKLNV